MGMLVPEHSTAKGPAFFYLDEMSKKPNARELLRNFASAISDTASAGFRDLHTVYDQHLLRPLAAGPSVAGITSYLQQSWFDQASSQLYFPHLPPVAPIIAMGTLKTIELSLRGESYPLPIDSWWIVDQPDVRIINLVSPQQVTHIMATPRPAGKFPGGVWGKSAEAYTTGAFGVVTRRLDE